MKLLRIAILVNFYTAYINLKLDNMFSDTVGFIALFFGFTAIGYVLGYDLNERKDNGR